MIKLVTQWTINLKNVHLLIRLDAVALINFIKCGQLYNSVPNCRGGRGRGGGAVTIRHANFVREFFSYFKCYSGHLLVAVLKCYLKRRNCRAYIFFARYLFLPFLHYFIYIFSIRVFFHRHWRFTEQQGKGEDHLLFHSTTSTYSRTFRHLFATLHARWLSCIFNLDACIYQTTTRWDLPPYWLMMQCLFVYLMVWL